MLTLWSIVAIGFLEGVLRKFYDVPENVGSRVWHHYRSNRHEQLKDPHLTLEDAGLSNGQVMYYSICTILLFICYAIYYQLCMGSHICR